MSSSLKRFKISKRGRVRDWGVHVLSYGTAISDFGDKERMLHLQQTTINTCLLIIARFQGSNADSHIKLLFCCFWF